VVCQSVGLSVCHSSDPAKRAEPIKMPFVFKTWARWVEHLDGFKEACIRWDAHWCNVANPTKLSM